MKYQIMPDLSPDEYKELKNDISERGVMVPIEFDEDGNVLDGHHRLKICVELGIEDYPKIIRTGMIEAQKRTHARKLNMARRHMTQEQKREMIREQLFETPEKSDRQIATDFGVDHKTVSKQRFDLESVGEIPQLSVSIGADGKEYPRQTDRNLTSLDSTKEEKKSMIFTDAVHKLPEDFREDFIEKRKFEIQARIREENQKIDEEYRKANEIFKLVHAGYGTVVTEEKVDIYLNHYTEPLSEHLKVLNETMQGLLEVKKIIENRNKIRRVK